MNLLKWLGVAVLDRLGWAGTTGVVVLLLSALHYMVQIVPLQGRLAAARVEATAKGPLAAPRGAQRGDLVSFKAFFAGGPVEERLSEIHDSGKATGLTFKRIEYRILEERRSGLKQYQIVMPVRSSYPSIRQFTSLALAKVPAMSLDHIHFRRKSIADGTVEAELRFTLFLSDPV